MIKDIRDLLMCITIFFMVLMLIDIKAQLRQLQGDTTAILKVAEAYEK